MVPHYPKYSVFYNNSPAKLRYNHGTQETNVIYYYHLICISHLSIASYSNMSYIYRKRLSRISHYSWLLYFISLFKSETVPQSFLNFDDLNTFGDYRPFIWLQFGVV